MSKPVHFPCPYCGRDTAGSAEHIIPHALKGARNSQGVANSGTTNIAFVGSVQNDPGFQVYYSCEDEWHSAYLACGMEAVLRFIEMFESQLRGG